MVPGEGLEPSRAIAQQILSLHCIPFQHPGISNNFYKYKAKTLIKQFRN